GNVFFFQAEDGIRDFHVTGVQTCALPIFSGAFEHTINMHYKGQPMRAFVLQGAAPQIVLGVSPKTMPNFGSVADLKGRKIGVTRSEERRVGKEGTPQARLCK